LAGRIAATCTATPVPRLRPWSAMRDYAELITAALDVTVPNGMLIAASSTHKMSPAEFEVARRPAACRRRR